MILCKQKSAPLTAAALKASAGLAEHLEIYLAPSLKHAVHELKRSGGQYGLISMCCGGGLGTGTIVERIG